MWVKALPGCTERWQGNWKNTASDRTVEKQGWLKVGCYTYCHLYFPLLSLHGEGSSLKTHMRRYFLLGVRDGQIALWVTGWVLKRAPFFPHAILLFLAPFASSTVTPLCGDEPGLYVIIKFGAVKKAFSLHHYHTSCTLWNVVLPPLVLQMKGHKNTINGVFLCFKHKRRSENLERKSPIVHSGVLLHIWLPFEGGIGLRTLRQPLWSVNTYPHMYVNKYKSMGFLSDQEQLTCTLSDGYTSVSHR